MHTSCDATVRCRPIGFGSWVALCGGLLFLSACGSGAPDDSFEPEGEVAGTVLGGIAAALEDEDRLLLAEGESWCLDDVSDYGARGPFRYSSRRVGRVNMLVPSVPEGCRVPVAHFANGTSTSCYVYQSILNSLASHGFLTTCYESTNTGAGTQGLEALETAVATYPQLAARRFASLGHSQGGQAAFIVLARAEARFGTDALYAGLAMQPASGFGAQPIGTTWQSMYGRIRSPMFMFSGTADILVSASWVRRAFEALDDDVEAYNWSAFGATHIPTPNNETIEVAIPWFRWKLLGDSEACRRFKSLESGLRWSERQVQNEASCD